MKLGSSPIATVLRNYSCKESERFAYWLAERLESPRYGGAVIDPNEGFPSNLGPWYEQFKARSTQGRYMIPLLSSVLNQVDGSEQYPGIALVSEILYYSDQESSNGGFPSNLLIPICINCSPADLARPKGEYEQLQDIVVPFVETRRPLLVSTSSFYSSAREMKDLADEVALRMGIQPREAARSEGKHKGSTEGKDESQDRKP